MNIIIFGDKYQKRMKSRGCVGLIKLQHKNIFHHQYKTLKAAFPNCNIIYIYGFEGKKFSSYITKNYHYYPDLHIIYNKDYDESNNGYSLYLAEKYLVDNCFMLFGDNIMANHTFDNFHISGGSQIFINKKTKTRLGCIINETKIENIAYDLDNYLSEIYYISKRDIPALRQLVQNTNHHNYFIFELINKMIDLNCDMRAFVTNHKNQSNLLKQ